jgi:hypothetical protein
MPLSIIKPRLEPHRPTVCDIRGLIEQAQVYYRSRTNRSAIQSYLHSVDHSQTRQLNCVHRLVHGFLLSRTTQPRFPLALVSFLLGNMLSPPALFSPHNVDTPCPQHRLDDSHLASATPCISSCEHHYPQGIANSFARGALLCYFR